MQIPLSQKLLYLLITVVVAFLFWQERGHPLALGETYTANETIYKSLLINTKDIDLDTKVFQEKCSEAKSFKVKGWAIQPLAKYQIRARILSTKRYKSDNTSKISPVDLALGWGEMRQEEILKHIKVSQSGRWYRWRVQEFPIPQKRIECQSANVHIIPADKRLWEAAKALDEGQEIEMAGYLVEARRPDNARPWRSSLSRNDTGDGACEVFYLVSLKVLND